MYFCPHRISEYERSRRAPSLRSVYRLADAIGCTVHDLLPAVAAE
jgi:transcriptional regulator with XRE-family HTH domain